MDHAAHAFGRDLILMLAAVALVSAAFRKNGWNPMLGLVAAGAAIGPHGFRLIGESSSIDFMSELGIMFLLFLVGLELSFERIRTMSRWIFGLGLTHFALCGAALTGVVWAFGGPVPAAVAVGVALAMSSTAFVLQVLSERGEMTTRHGRKAFSVLLFQDLTVPVILAAVPILAGGALAGGDGHGMQMVPAVLCMFVLFMVARLLLLVLLSAVREYDQDDAFPAAVVFIALAMGFSAGELGLSPSLGAFLAGLAISEATWRHEVKEAIAPFERTLLAFFFLAVGFKIPLSAPWQDLLVILGAALAILAAKAASGVVACLANGVGWRDAVRTSAAVAQAGEFSFVVIAAAAANLLVPADMATLWISGAVVSMGLTPLLIALASRLACRGRAPEGEGDGCCADAPAGAADGTGAKAP